MHQFKCFLYLKSTENSNLTKSLQIPDFCFGPFIYLASGKCSKLIEVYYITNIVPMGVPRDRLVRATYTGRLASVTYIWLVVPISPGLRSRLILGIDLF